MAHKSKKSPRGPASPDATERHTVTHGPGRGWLWFWIAATIAGFGFRIILILATHGSIYPGDHDDFVRWGIQSTDEGILSLYHKAPARHNWEVWQDDQPRIAQRAYDRVCNYPPLSAYVLYASGVAFKAVSTDRVINTDASRLLFCGWSILGDVILAAGCAAIVALWRPRWAARLTYVLALLVPPFWWDSVMWGQMDSVVLAPLVWMLYAMLRDRWLLAGVLWGIAFGLKPQAILFIPVWGLALVTVRPFWRPVLGGVVAAIVLFATSVPFMLHGAAESARLAKEPAVQSAVGAFTMQTGFAWFRLSYWETMFSTYAHLTTLKAFNLWYLDLLFMDSLDTLATWFGWTKARWGQVFLLTALLVGFFFTIWRWRRDRRGLAVFSVVCLLAFVMLPTQVHERYVILTLPFIGVAAALSWRFWPGLLLLIIVTTAQISWPLWLHSAAGQTAQICATAEKAHAQLVARAAGHPEQKVPSLQVVTKAYEAQYRRDRAQSERYEWLYTGCALLGTVLTAWAVVTLRPHAPPARTAARQTTPQ